MADTEILCPFFRRERKKSITCEDTIRSYASRSDKNQVLKAYCSDGWERCPYASRMHRIYSQNLPDHKIKENIMENTIEQQKKEINKLMRENGRLRKKIEKFEKEIKQRDEIAAKNHEMYLADRREKQFIIEDKDKLIRWLESFAAAFLAVAYGEETVAVSIPKEKVMKLMTSYKLKIKEIDGAFEFEIEHLKGDEDNGDSNN